MQAQTSGFTAGHKNCGKSGLVHGAAGPPGRHGPRAARPSTRWAVAGRGPAFSKTPCFHAIILPGIDVGDVDEIFQSAYKQLHSTETALVGVNNDILVALDNHQSVILLLLDLPAAFDTVDHGILLDWLIHHFGICGLALSWFKSYLSNRFQFVEIRGEKSSHQPLMCGVPQGSVLGPILYLLYTLPLGDIVRRYNMGFHFYADDT